MITLLLLYFYPINYPVVLHFFAYFFPQRLTDSTTSLLTLSLFSFSSLRYLFEHSRGWLPHELLYLGGSAGGTDQ